MGGNVKTNKRQQCAAVAEHRPNELQPSMTLVSLNTYKTAPIIAHPSSPRNKPSIKK